MFKNNGRQYQADSYHCLSLDASTTDQSLIVDDSALVRQVLTQLLEGFADIEVLGSAPDPLFAYKMNKDWPDVITLDVEMPRMDGITFLKQIMQTRPTPVLICSSLTEKGAATTVQAMQAGAAGIFTKPQLGVKDFLQASKQQFADAIREAARTNTRNLLPRQLQPPAPLLQPVVNTDTQAMARTTERVIAIGTSTGWYYRTGVSAIATHISLRRHCHCSAYAREIYRSFCGEAQFHLCH